MAIGPFGQDPRLNPACGLYNLSIYQLYNLSIYQLYNLSIYQLYNLSIYQVHPLYFHVQLTRTDDLFSAHYMYI